MLLLLLGNSHTLNRNEHVGGVIVYIYYVHSSFATTLVILSLNVSKVMVVTLIHFMKNCVIAITVDQSLSETG